MEIDQFNKKTGYYDITSRGRGNKNYDYFDDKYLMMCDISTVEGLYDITDPDNPVLIYACVYETTDPIVRHFGGRLYILVGDVNPTLYKSSSGDLDTCTWTNTSVDLSADNGGSGQILDLFEDGNSNVWVVINRDISAPDGSDAVTIYYNDFTSFVYTLTTAKDCACNGYVDGTDYYFLDIDVAANSIIYERKCNLATGTFTEEDSTTLTFQVDCYQNSGIIYKGVKNRFIFVASYSAQGFWFAFEDTNEDWKVLDSSTSTNGSLGLCWSLDGTDYILDWIYCDETIYRVFPTGRCQIMQKGVDDGPNSGFDNIFCFETNNNAYVMEPSETKDGNTISIKSFLGDISDGRVLITDTDADIENWTEGEYIRIYDYAGTSVFFRGVIVDVFQKSKSIVEIEIAATWKIDFDKEITYDSSSATDNVAITAIIAANCDYIALSVSDFDATARDLKYNNTKLGSIVDEMAKRQSTYWYVIDEVLTFDDGSTSSGVTIDASTGDELISMAYKVKTYPVKRVKLSGKVGVTPADVYADDVIDGYFVQKVYPQIQENTTLTSMATTLLANMNVKGASLQYTIRKKGCIQWGRQVNLKAPVYNYLTSAFDNAANYYTSKVSYNPILNECKVYGSNYFLVQMEKKPQTVTPEDNYNLVSQVSASAYTDEQARAAIGDIFGADGKADSNIDLDSHKLINVTDPTGPQDAATKSWVEGLAYGTTLQLANNTFAQGRNAADNAWIDIIKVNASNHIEFGDSFIYVKEGKGIIFEPAGYIEGDGTGFNISAAPSGKHILIQADQYIEIRSGTYILLKPLADYIQVYEDKELQFRDTGLKIYSSADGQLDIESDGIIKLASTTHVDLNSKKIVSLADPTANQDATTKVWVENYAIEDTADIIKDTHIDWGEGAGQVSAADIPIATLNGTAPQMQMFVDGTQSSQYYSGGIVTENSALDGTIDITELTGYIKKTDDNEAMSMGSFTISAVSAHALSSGINIICVDYNSGTPIFSYETTIPNKTTKFPVARVYKDVNSHLHIVQGGSKFLGLPLKVNERFFKVDGLVRASGMITTEATESLAIDVSAGVLWRGLNEFTFNDYNGDELCDITGSGTGGTVSANNTIVLDSGCGDLTAIYTHGLEIRIHDSSNSNDGCYHVESSSWDGTNTTVVVEGTALTTGNDTGHVHTHTFTYWHYRKFDTTWVETNQAGDHVSIHIDVDYYNDIDDADNGDELKTYISNRYGCAWVYASSGQKSRVHVLYGQGSYTLAAAIEANPPSTVPDIVNKLCFLIAKIVFQEGDTEFYDVYYPWTTIFSSTGADDHGGMGGLDDDDHPQYLLADGTRNLSDDLLVVLTKKIEFGDDAVHIASANDGYLDLTADTGIRLDAATTMADGKKLSIKSIQPIYVSVGGTAGWYKLGYIQVAGGRVVIRVHGGNGYGDETYNGEVYGQFSVGNADNEFGGFYYELGQRATNVTFEWVRTAALKIDCYVYLPAYFRGSFEIIEGIDFSLNTSASTKLTDPTGTNLTEYFPIQSDIYSSGAIKIRCTELNIRNAVDDDYVDVNANAFNELSAPLPDDPENWKDLLPEFLKTVIITDVMEEYEGEEEGEILYRKIGETSKVGLNVGMVARLALRKCSEQQIQIDELKIEKDNQIQILMDLNSSLTNKITDLTNRIIELEKG